MALVNLTGLTPATFILVGIPGMEQLHTWISIPFCTMYLATLLGNGVLLFTIWSEHSLHQRMHLFLSVLAVADLALSTTAVPKMLALFWFRAREISFGACLTQMFFLHFTCSAESMILLAMAFDHFVAICHPLRYGARLPFCGHNVILHMYCEHIGIARLACADISASLWYGLTVPLAVVALDLVLIAVSYAFILVALPRLPSRTARHKAFNTCGSHICVLVFFYVPAGFTALTHRFGRDIPRHVHILLANLYVLFLLLLNPVVYGVKTQRIREKVVKVFVCSKGRFPGQQEGK
ncbi:Olfactory receptor 52B2 [Pitangus sulphuratus]|nr:Olfactory receptor 52B2 [Pitangus sulphuratus]